MHISFVIQKDEITSCEERVKKLIELTPPKGKEFLHKIEHILEREKNWVSLLLSTSSLCSLAHKPVIASWRQGYIYYLYPVLFRCGGNVMAAHHMKNNLRKRKSYKMGRRSGMLGLQCFFYCVLMILVSQEGD
jgi:hypothetical protein